MHIIILVATFAKIVESEYALESKVVNGEYVPITEFAHSAFLIVNEPQGSFVCGASVVNQNLLLTAAHCIDTCGKKCPDAAVYAGNANKREGTKMGIAATKIHERYRSNRINNDIGLILLEEKLSLGKYIMRVALMRQPPTERNGIIAGWGLIDEVNSITTDSLHYVKQRIWYQNDCRNMISSLPEGTLCAGDVDGEKYASEGDSGSALVVKNYIQIGIVSYKRPDVSVAIVVYTDVSYFYDWIKKNSKKMYCARRKLKK